MTVQIQKRSQEGNEKVQHSGSDPAHGIFLVPAFATIVKELNWDDLKPVVEFDDPFEKLSQEQLKQATSINAGLLRFLRSRDPYKEIPLGIIEEGAWTDMNKYNNSPLEDIMVVA